ncbi:MAG: PD-(D/E)XK nuclease family protein, partial [Pirellulaceae bacterium]
ARDAYAIHCLIASRESVRLIVARRNRDGDPLAPSRLLFATDPVSAARRALAFFADASAARRHFPAGETRGEKAGQLSVPRPRPLTAPLTQLNVTSFRDYRACPYRFYLRHVLRLESIDDDAHEMDGREFGNLAHDVLREFGRHRRRNSTDPDEIAALLSRELDRCAARRYGRHTLPAVLVQIEQLRLRLKALAPLQAERAAAGWTIACTEISPPADRPAQLLVDGTPFFLRGRMDRIDVHVESGQHIIWDYKTSDSVLDPDKTHREHGEWIDWQLPLYRHLAAAAGISGPLQVGYILLPKDTSRVAMVTADWDEASLASADQSACEIIRSIRQEIFWPPARVPPVFADAYAAICQEGVLGG